MRNKIAVFFLLSVIIAIFSCNKEPEYPIPDNNNTTETYEQYGTPFANVPAIEDIVMYEVNLRAYSSTGDLQGVIDKLDYIKSLGVNVIWLMPIYPIGQLNSVNSPYCVKDYKAVGTEFGTLEDLRTLTDQAHSRGMAVILDWVANHTSWDNEWINNRTWYTQDENGEIISPAGTNWTDVADLNYDNTAMRAEMIDAMKYWAYVANVDGFRCDHADGVPYDFWVDAWNKIRAIPNRDFILFAEGSRSDHFDAGFDLNFGWDTYSAIKNVFNGNPVSNIFSANTNEYYGVSTGKHWIKFTTNHDESAWDATPITLFNGVDGALAASVAAIFTGGVPLIYGSQEVGTANTVSFFENSTINWDNNPAMLESYKKILQFYSSNEAARKGENTVFADNDIFCLKKTYNSQEVLIIANLRNSIINFVIPSALESSVWTNVITNSNTTLSGQLSLNAYQFYILKK